MLGIGIELRRRGYDVVVSIAEPYAALATEAGLRVNIAIDSAAFDRLVGGDDVWHPFVGARRVFQWAAEDFAPTHLRLIQSEYRPGRTVLVSHPLDFASRIFRETNPLPLIDVHLAPSMLRTPTDYPRMTNRWYELRRPAPLVRLAYWMVDRLLVDPVTAPSINRLREQLASTAGGRADTPRPVRRVLDRWWLSPDAILAMYPPWFAPAVARDFPVVHHCGFPLVDNFGGRTDDAGEIRTGEIVFTSGTAHRHGTEFFAAAAKACQTLGRPGLLLTSHTPQLPADLPDNVRSETYVPLSRHLQHAAAIVHHGGIGTTAAGLAAGVPQLILPMAFDQFDNARHLSRLGVGRSATGPPTMASSLACLIGEADYRTNAVDIAANFPLAVPAVTLAVNAIETHTLRSTSFDP